MKSRFPLIIVCLVVGVVAGYVISMAVAPVTAPSLPTGERLIAVASPYGVSETMDLLSTELSDRGATIFARIDHAAGASSINEVLPATETLIFGNPMLGTALIQSEPNIALDLPLRVLAHEGGTGGGSTLTYLAPAVLAARYDIVDQANQIERISAILEAVIAATVAE